MTALHLHNTITSDQQVQAHILYHWLVYVSKFTEIEASGANWSTLHFSGSDGVVNSSTPGSFYDANPVFDATFVGKHIAIRDSDNPTNSFIAEITAVPSTTRVDLDSSAVLSVDSTSVDYVVFDTVAAPPATGDYFVIENPSGNVGWQARCIVGSSPASLEWEFGFVGGWDTGTTSWNLSVSSSHYMHDTLYSTFCVADAAAGWVYIWSEDGAGGASADRHALWFGSLSPFHSPSETGVPKDLSYSAIFGSTNATPPASNLSRDTGTADNFAVGEMIDDSSTVVGSYIAQQRLLSSGTDMLSVAAAATNPFSLETDDYDAIVFNRAPDQAWRGRLPGVRTLNDSVANRTSINNNLTYVLGNGLGAVWNGKAPLP